MSNKKEITIDASAFGDSFVGFKFFVEQAEYTSRQIGPPIVRLQVLGVVDQDALYRGRCPQGEIIKGQIERADIKLASDALKSAADSWAGDVDVRWSSVLPHGIYDCIVDIAGQEVARAVDKAMIRGAKKYAPAPSRAVAENLTGTSAGDVTAEQASRPLKTVIPEGVSIHHDLERRFTIAYRISANGKLAFVGIAYCSPQDQFCRRTGRELAISRLDERPCRVVKLPRVMAPGTDDYPKNGAEWRAVEQSILLGLGLLR